jgi:MGT family glycosyltransferase
MQVRLDWLRLRCLFFFNKTLASHLLGEFRHPTRMHFLTGEFRRLARCSGIDCRENHTYWLGITGPHLMLPEIMLCPRSFEFPQALVRDRRYVGGKVDLGRIEDTSLLERVDQKKPLVYCSLGSDARFYPHSRHFFRTVVAAARLRSDWQWVLSVGSQLEADRYPETPSNMLVAAWAPQIAILHRAAAMVTHGGLNSMMECVHFGVPMVVVPGLRDQPGNMARAVHHGIAAGAPMKNLKPDQLVHRIDRTIHSPEIRRALVRMRDAIAAENGLDDAIDLVESYAPPAREATA